MSDQYTFEQFTNDALRTESRPESLKINPLVFVTYLQLAIVTANLGDMLKKGAFYGKQVDVERFTQEAIGIRNLADILAATGTSVNDLEAKPLNVRSRNDDGEAVEVELTPTSFNMRVAHGLLGNFTEAGELMEALLNATLDSKPLDRVNIGEEFADQDWYKAIVFDALGLDETETRRGVIAKLRKRYPEKFEETLAASRDLEAERQALESNIS